MKTCLQVSKVVGSRQYLSVLIICIYNVVISIRRPRAWQASNVLEVSWALFRADYEAFTHPNRPWCASWTREDLRRTKFWNTYAVWPVDHTRITRRADHEKAQRALDEPRFTSCGEHQTWRLRSSTGSVAALLRYGALKRTRAL